MTSFFRFLPRAAVPALAVALAAALTASAACAADLTGHDSSTGKVLVALYNDSKAFPRTPLKGAEAPAVKGAPALLAFKDLPPGVYALSAYHDENSNDKLDRGMFHIPTENYGFSRDARGDKGPPEFRDAQIEMRDASMKIAIKLR